MYQQNWIKQRDFISIYSQKASVKVQGKEVMWKSKEKKMGSWWQRQIWKRYKCIMNKGYWTLFWRRSCKDVKYWFSRVCLWTTHVIVWICCPWYNNICWWRLKSRLWNNPKCLIIIILQQSFQKGENPSFFFTMKHFYSSITCKCFLF